MKNSNNNKEATQNINVVFLDVDGVLNCSTTTDGCGPYIGIEDKKVSLLKQIVESANAVIVLVSSWKEYWCKQDKESQDDLADYLDMKLAKQDLYIYDKTDDYNSFNRGDGVWNYIDYLKEQNINVNKFVILDDEMFDYNEVKLTKYLIKTNFYRGGLQEKHIQKAVNILC